MMYVDQIGEVEFPPPYDFPGVTILSFRLAADIGALTTLCDRVLNVGTLEQRGFEYCPFLPFVDLEILSYPKMENAIWPQMGYTSQNECYVRIFVWKFVEFWGWLIPTLEVASFIPFIVVDNPLSAFAGRDVLGLPKLLGSFGAFSPASPFGTVSTLEFPTYTAASTAAIMPVVTVKPSALAAAQAPAVGQWPWGDIDPSVAPPALQPMLKSSRLANQMTMGAVQMKQFRDGELSATTPYPMNACYQAIVRGDLIVRRILNAGALPAATITINDYASVDLAQSLGVSPNVPLQPLSQYYVQCDLSYRNVKTLFVNSDS